MSCADFLICCICSRFYAKMSMNVQDLLVMPTQSALTQLAHILVNARLDMKARALRAVVSGCVIDINMFSGITFPMFRYG